MLGASSVRARLSFGLSRQSGHIVCAKVVPKRRSRRFDALVSRRRLSTGHNRCWIGTTDQYHPFTIASWPLPGQWSTDNTPEPPHIPMAPTLGVGRGAPGATPCRPSRELSARFQVYIVQLRPSRASPGSPHPVTCPRGPYGRLSAPAPKRPTWRSAPLHARARLRSSFSPAAFSRLPRGATLQTRRWTGTPN